MATYSINFYHSLLIGEIVSNPSVQLPTIKQTNLHLNWLDTLLEPVQRLNDIVNLYNNGSSYSFYNNLNTYQLGDRINGGLNYNNVIYECVNPALSTATISNIGNGFSIEVLKVGNMTGSSFQLNIITVGGTGNITSYGVASGGSGYTLYETFYVNGGLSLATGYISSVTTGGVVTGVLLLTEGSSYSASTTRSITLTSGSNGPIISSQIYSAGYSYSVGDTFYVNGSSVSAFGNILSVGATSGAVLTYDIIYGGNYYNNSVGVVLTSTYSTLDITTITASGAFNISNWLQILPSFIGYQERSNYYDSRIVYEYALNRYFYSQFRQPNFYDTIKSDIWIGDNELSNTQLWIGPTDYSSGFIGLQESTIGGPGTTKAYIGLDPSLFAPGIHETFIINVPNWLYTTLPGYNGITGSADKVIRNYADKINYAGMTYIINVIYELGGVSVTASTSGSTLSLEALYTGSPLFFTWYYQTVSSAIMPLTASSLGAVVSGYDTYYVTIEPTSSWLGSTTFSCYVQDPYGVGYTASWI